MDFDASSQALIGTVQRKRGVASPSACPLNCEEFDGLAEDNESLPFARKLKSRQYLGRSKASRRM